MSNFNKNNTKMFNHTKQRWGLRKLSVGVASVLLGFTFLGVQSQQALADTNTATGNVDGLATTANQQISGNQVVLAAGQEATTVNQTPVVPNGYANAMNGFRPKNGPENGNTQAIINSSTDAIKENGGDPTTKFNKVGFQTDSNGNMSVTMSASNYKSNPADAAETVDLQNLTSTQQNEITTFAAQVINQIRSEVQAQSNGKNVSAGFLKVSPFATQAGNSIVHAAYDNFTGEGHNMAGLEAAAKNLGINSWVGENIGGLLTGTALEAGWVKTITMDQLKNDIYLSILSMMYVDNNSNSIGAGGHTTALLNDPSYNENSNNGGNAISLDRNGNVIANQYLALTIDKRNRVHFNFISDAGASADAKAKLAQGAFQPMFLANDHNHGQSSSAESSASSSAESSASSSAESSASSSAESSASSSAESSVSSSAINTDNIANNATSNVSDGHHVTASRSNVQAGAVNANKKLPQTGNNNEGSLFALAMLVLSTCFGLGLRKKRD